jgi:hypothetical protein
MTLHIELPEEIEKRVVGAAAKRNLPVEEYVLSIVDSSTPAQGPSAVPPEDFGAYLKSLALFAGKTPNYPPDFWTREIVSGDDD